MSEREAEHLVEPGNMPDPISDSTESSDDSPLFRIDDLRVGFWSRGRWVQAVDGASVALGQKEGLALIGESGSGKTLTMMSSLALIPPNPGVIGGSIRYHDGDDSISLLDGVEDAYHWNDGVCAENVHTEKWRLHYRRRAQYLAGLKIGIIFQNPISSLDPLYSVGATLMESIRLRNPALTRKEAYEEAVDWLDRVHISNPTGVMRSYPHQLSGGMCQRVMIAATLSMRPRIIIADEPTTGLDMTTKAQILYLLHEARSKYGSSLIFVTHEIGLVTGLTERVVVMRSGHVVDRFPTSHLSGVSRIGGELKTTFSFAEHTQELLSASLKLEGDSPLETSSVEEIKEAPTDVVLVNPDDTEGGVTLDEPEVAKYVFAVQEEHQIEAWQNKQVKLVLGTAGASVLFSVLTGWLGFFWFLIVPLLGLWGYTLYHGGYVTQTIHKHRVGSDLLPKMSWTRWLGYTLPGVWLLIYLWNSGTLRGMFS